MLHSQTSMILESREPYCSTECVICDAIRLADCRSSNYNPIAVVDESHYDDRVFDRNDWRGTNNMQSPAFPLGSVPNPIAVPEESYGYHRDYDTGTRTYGYQNDSFKPSFDTSLSVPPCTQGAQYFDLSPLGYTLDTWSMMIPELYPPSPFPSGGNVMDLNEASKDYSGFYTDGRSQAISFPFIPLPNAMLAYGDHESLQVFGQSPTSNPCPVDETLDITGIFDLQAYYYDTGANPFQKPPTESRYTWSTNENTTSEETLQVTPPKLRRSQRLIEKSRAA